MLTLFTPLWAPRLIYGARPEYLDKQHSSTLRFSLRDVACLFVYVGITNAIFRSIHGLYRFFPALSILMPILVNLLTILTWILAIRFADRWNATTTIRRSLAILFFFPLSAVLAAQILTCGLILLSGVERFTTEFLAGLDQYLFALISITGLTIILIGVLTIYTLRRAWRMVSPK